MCSFREAWPGAGGVGVRCIGRRRCVRGLLRRRVWITRVGRRTRAAAESRGQFNGQAGDGVSGGARWSTQALDAMTSADQGTCAGVAEGGAQGRTGADGVVDDARRGVAAIAPATNTQAGKVERGSNHAQERLMQMRGKLLLIRTTQYRSGPGDPKRHRWLPQNEPRRGAMHMSGGGPGISPASFGGRRNPRLHIPAPHRPRTTRPRIPPADVRTLADKAGRGLDFSAVPQQVFVQRAAFAAPDQVRRGTRAPTRWCRCSHRWCGRKV